MGCEHMACNDVSLISRRFSEFIEYQNGNDLFAVWDDTPKLSNQSRPIHSDNVMPFINCGSGSGHCSLMDMDQWDTNKNF